MNDEPKVMTVAEIRENLARGKTLTLPSGIVIRVKRLTPMDYIKEGLAQIPNEFYKFAVELSVGKVSGEGEQDEIRKKNLEIFEKFVDITLDKGVIEPKVMFKYDEAKKETHLLYSELSNEDQLTLLNSVVGK